LKQRNIGLKLREISGELAWNLTATGLEKLIGIEHFCKNIDGVENKFKMIDTEARLS